MSDETPFPSLVRIRLNGYTIGTQYLADDPADHRGILSWHAQLRDRRLREAGSYGYLVRINIPRHVLEAAAAEGELNLRLEVDAAFPGGLAIYGEDFGRYPFDPTLILAVKE
jgi:predicted transcriptional regulator